MRAHVQKTGYRYILVDGIPGHGHGFNRAKLLPAGRLWGQREAGISFWPLAGPNGTKGH